MHELSKSFHKWFEEAEARATEPRDPVETRELTRDVLIVGSGYGGSVAAARLARALQIGAFDRYNPPSICVVERGREYQPGSFPEGIGELPSHISVSGPARASDIGYPDSLYQIRNSSPDSDVPVYALTGCGLGGGSLINANVAVEPPESVWSRTFWPRALRTDSPSLKRWYETARTMLRAAPIPLEYTPRKLQRLQETAQVLEDRIREWSAAQQDRPRFHVRFERPPLTVAFEESPWSPGQDLGARHACTSCGNCATGCNVGAKHTLATTYLRMACAWNAEMVTGGTAELIRKPDDEEGDFEVWVIPTTLAGGAPPRRRVRVKARVVIVAAGAIGSPELLLRSPEIAPGLSMLGKRLGTNGDSISAHYGHKLPVNVQGHGLRAPLVKDRETLPGPTITGMIRIEPESPLPDRDPTPSYTIEDAGIPSSLATLLAETLTTLNLPREMGDDRILASFGDTVTRYGPYANPTLLRSTKDLRTRDPVSVDPQAIAHSQIFLTMTRDPGHWEVRMRPDNASNGLGEEASGAYVPPSQVQIHGTRMDHRPRDSASGEPPDPLDLLDGWMTGLASLGGRYLPNPLREPFPKLSGMTVVGAGGGGGRLTVHPLGGCVMADSRATGVVNHRGQVFDGKGARTPDEVIPGLYVLDGSIIPCSLETNPFLTITALAERAVHAIVREDLFPRVSGLDPSRLDLAADLGRPPLEGAPSRLPEPGILRRRVPPEPRLSRIRFRERLHAKLSQGDAFLKAAAPPPAPDSDTVATRSEEPRPPGETATHIGPVRPHLVVDLEYEPEDLKTFLEQHPHSAPLTGTLRVATSPMDQIRPYQRWQAHLRAPLVNGRMELFTIRPGIADTRATKALSTYSCRRMLVESLRELLYRESTPTDQPRDFEPGITSCVRALVERMLVGERPDGSAMWSMITFASYVGIARTISYEAETHIENVPMRFIGRKDISYRLGSNVWRDLGTLSVRVHEARTPKKEKGRLFWEGQLEFDGAYLVREGLPQVVDQLDLPSTVESLIRFAMFFVRAVFQVYFWEFTPADYPSPATRSKPLGLQTGVYEGFTYWAEYEKRIDMPGAFRDGTTPSRIWLEVVPEVQPDLTPVRTKIFGKMRETEALGQTPTRLRFYGAHWAAAQLENGSNGTSKDDGRHVLLHAYRQPFKTGVFPRAVLLLHGFALSSTMYTSRALPSGLAEYLFNAGYDVYIADMRTSFMLPRAMKHGITFDEVALRDIPAMVDFVRWDPLRSRDPAVGSPRISVVAHCMGSAQFGMFLLARGKVTAAPGNEVSLDELAPFYRRPESIWGEYPEAYLADRIPNADPRDVEKNEELIGSAALFQVSPFLAVTPNNSLRAELAALMNEFIGNELVTPWLKSGDADNAGLTLADRIASTLAESDYLEPMRGGYDHDVALGITRRAFLLYGRTWVQKNLAPVTRSDIDQIIGPVNLRSYRQSGYFALSGRVVDRDGRNRYLDDQYLYEAFRFPSLWLHGSRSDMFDARTVLLFPHRINVMALAETGNQETWAWVKPLSGYGHLDSLIGADTADHFEDVAYFLRDATVVSGGNDEVTASRMSQRIKGLLAGEDLDALIQYEAEPLAISPPRAGPFAGALRSFDSDKDKDARKRRRLWFQIDHTRSHVPAIGFTVCVRQSNGEFKVRAETLELWAPEYSAVLDCHWVACDALAADSGRGEFTLAGELRALISVGSKFVTSVGKQPDYELLGEKLPRAKDGNPVLGRLLRLNRDREQGRVMVNMNQADVTEAIPLIQERLTTLSRGGQSADDIAGVFRPVARGTGVRSILIGSCVYPGLGVADALVSHPFDEMRRLLVQGHSSVEGLFLIGDSVYLDAFNTVVSAEPTGTRPRSAYEKLMRNAADGAHGLQGVASRVPVHFCIDDHEYRDNFAGDDSPEDVAMHYAFIAWQIYAWSVSPECPAIRVGLNPLGRSSRKDLLPQAGFCYPTEICGCPGFVLDMRSYRNPDRRILFGCQQIERFRSWAKATALSHPGKPRLVICGAPIFPFTYDQKRDFESGWRDDVPAVYENDIACLFGALVQYSETPVIIVSGDLHLSATAEGSLTRSDGRAVPIASVVSSGLFSPLPFANTSINGLADEGCHRFGDLVLDYRTTWISDNPGFIDLQVSEIGETEVTVHKYGPRTGGALSAYELEAEIDLWMR